MKKFLTILFYSLFIISLFSCEEEYIEPYERFIIPEGKHSQGMKLEALQTSTLNFTAMFDESSIYQTEIIENQHDINKLFGFSDCNSNHHENSARFGWRWLEGELEIHAYAYVNGERIAKIIGTVDLNKAFDYQLKVTKDAYVFYLQGYDKVEIERGNTCDKGLYYMLFPYFGGNETAPHDILIRIKRNY